jgi:flagellar biosynthesis/type III secretory pathway protein FliH
VSAGSVRIVRAGEGRVERLFAPGPTPLQRRRIARQELEAKLAAETLLAEARASASAIVSRAREEALEKGAAAVREAEERASAKLAAQWLALRREEGKVLSRQTEQVVALAGVLAERLVGAALRVEPAVVADLARTVLAEAQGARRAVVGAHPLDAEALRGHLITAGLGLDTVEVRPDETLERGHLKLHTDVGIIDAKLAPRLARLADALRDALR